MKKISVSLLSVALLGLCSVSAWAIPPFGEAFKKTYVEGNSNTAFVEAADAAKCNVCHVGKDKKEKNEYGKIVSKFLKKADFTGDTKKFDPKSEEGQKVLAEGLAKAGGEKAASGTTFADIIKSGKLPGGN